MRYYSYRTLRDYPLIVAVGVAEQDVLLAVVAAPRAQLSRRQRWSAR